MKKDELVSMKLALLAKQKGFNECVEGSYFGDGRPCYDTHLPNLDMPKLHFMSNDKLICSAPTQTTLARWLREKYGIHVECRYNINENFRETYQYFIVINKKLFINDPNKSNSYEQALEAGLFRGLDYVPNLS